MKPIIIGIWLTFCSDAAVTHYEISQLGAREIIQPTQNPFIIDGITASEAAAATYGLNWLEKNKHTKTAKIIGWTVIAFRGYVVARNLHEMSKR